MSASPIHSEGSSPRDSSGASLTVFDGFPYLITKVVGSLYHVILLPADQPEASLRAVAHAQRRANRLPTCLVFAENRAVYVSADDGTSSSGQAPRGGLLVADKLKPVAVFASPDLDRRRQRLAAIIADHPQGFLFGDLTKGGRPATADDLVRLEGAGSDGVPRGLERCPTCDDWRGQCLDPSPRFAGQVMTVHCRCANENRCACCGDLLYSRRLNANYYSSRDGRVWHVPGFSGFAHDCPFQADVPPLGYLPEMLGEWEIGYPGPDGLIPSDQRPQRLHLRDDGTFTWTPAPVWAPASGRWGVFRNPDGALRLCFEVWGGWFRCHVLVVLDMPGAGWTFHWQRTRSDAVVFADRILRATRPDHQRPV